MTDMKTLKVQWSQDPAFRAEYDALEEEFAMMNAMIAARGKANLTQDQVAERMHTKQTAIARLESGKANPSLKTLRSFAAATGSRLKISFEPA